jgi:hypothetical protein
MQEAHAHVAFEIDDPSIDSRQGHSEFASGGRESSRFCHGNER